MNTERRPRSAAGLWLGGVIGVLLVLLVLAEGAGWPFLQAPMQRALQSFIGVPVVLEGEFHTRLLWRPRLRVQHLSVGAAHGLALPHLLDAREVEVQWRWLDVWRWQRGAPLRLRSLDAAHLDARLMRLADGRASWDLATGAQEQATPLVERLVLTQAHVELDDSLERTRVVVDINSDSSRGDTPGGSYRAVAKGHYQDLPLLLTARSAGLLPLIDDTGEAPSELVPLRVEGTVGSARLLFDGRAAALWGVSRLEGELRLRARSMASVGQVLGLTLPRTPPFELDGRISLEQEVWRLQLARAEVGLSRLGGDLSYDTRKSPPLLSGRLLGSRLQLADLGPAIGVSDTAGATTRARAFPERKFDLPSLSDMDADIDVAIDEFHFGTSALQPMRQLSTHLRLRDSVLRLEPLQARLGGGEVAGSTVLDGSAQLARWSADLRFTRLDLADWIRGLRVAPADPAAPPAAAGASAATGKATPSDAPMKAFLSGWMTGTLQATGSGHSTAEILGSLNGQLQARLTDGKLSHLVTEFAGLDVAQALGVAIRGDAPLKLNCALLDLRVANGVAVPRQAVFDNVDSTLRVGGQIDLRDETLDLRAVARPKDVSPLALRSPVRITGTLADPQVGVDPAPLLARVAAAVALGIVATPAAALIPLIDVGDQQADPCAAPAPAAQGASAPASARR